MGAGLVLRGVDGAYQGWQYFSCGHRIIPGDLVMLRISGLGLRVQIYNDNSIGCRVRCSKHSCIRDLEYALWTS